ncbi:hypothetical protein MMPV_004320 [Pyropia vietnamensis]
MPPPSRPALPPPPPPSTFLIHGWRWHHLSLARDFAHLARVAVHPPPHTPPVCSAGGKATAAAIIDALTFLAAHNLGVHNRVEERLLFPFLAARLPQGHPVQRALPSFGDRRAALAARLATVSTAAAAVTPADTPACRAAWGGTVAPGLARLAAEAAALYAEEEAAVIPAVVATVDAASQTAFNRRVIRLVGGGGGVAGVALQAVVFHEVLFGAPRTGEWPEARGGARLWKGASARGGWLGARLARAGAAATAPLLGPLGRGRHTTAPRLGWLAAALRGGGTGDGSGGGDEGGAGPLSFLGRLGIGRVCGGAPAAATAAMAVTSADREAWSVAVPGVVRALIPRWRRRLYVPQAGALVP